MGSIIHYPMSDNSSVKDVLALCLNFEGINCYSNSNEMCRGKILQCD